MMNLLNYFYFLRSCCLHCGAFQAGSNLLCQACTKELSPYKRSSEAKIGLVINCLYRWVPGQSDLLSGLVSALKGGGCAKTWKVYAEELAKNSWSHLPEGMKICVVPAPGKSKDHAYEWGKALAQQLQAEFRPCLGKKNSRNQRGKNFYERGLLEMELLEKNTDFHSQSNEILWIFADDILTTGSTARAAHLALGRPPHFQVWVLAERSLSCRVSSNLL